MKRILLSSAILAVLLATCFAWACFTSGQASAQAPMGPPAQGLGGIALVDVNFIFKNHDRLRTDLKQLQAEAENVQHGFEKQLQDLQEQGKLLATLKPGSPEYQQLEEKLVTQKGYIQGQIALKRKDFVQREAKFYCRAYKEIQDEVYGYCQQRGISLVLNFNGDKIHEDSPDDVARGISNKVVFYRQELDITPDILRRFKQDPRAANNSPMGVFPQR